MRRNCLEISVAEERYFSGGRGRGRGRRQQSAGRVNTSSYRGDRDSDRFVSIGSDTYLPIKALCLDVSYFKTSQKEDQNYIFYHGRSRKIRQENALQLTKIFLETPKRVMKLRFRLGSNLSSNLKQLNQVPIKSKSV